MEENQGGRIRRRKRNFTTLSNHILTSNLSSKAIGIFARMSRLVDIPNFIVYKQTVINACPEGKTAFEAGWKELKDAGYLIQIRVQDKNGRFYYDYELVDDPTENNDSNDSNNRKSSNSKTDSPVPENEVAVKGQPVPQNPVPDNPVTGKSTTNNTITNNTVTKNTNYSSSSSINTTNTPREEISDTPVPLEEDDEKELNSITSNLFKKSYGKRLSSIPGQYGCDGNMIYPALKLALENGALDLIPYVKSIFKEWKGQGIKHLSDLGIEGITTKEQENEIIALYLEQLSSDNENPQKYDPELPDFMLRITDGQYYRDRSSEVKALSKLYSFNELVEKFRRTVIANQPINEAVKYLVNDFS